MKSIFQFLLLIIVFSCSSEKREENFIPGNYYIHQLNNVKLSQSGEIKAKAYWDSIKPLLIIDSTTTGYSYSGMGHEDTPVNAWLSFDFDTSSMAGGPHDLKIHLLLKESVIRKPSGYIYVGDRMIPLTGTSESFGSYILYTDTVGVVVEHAIRGLINREGIRFDTDRGPTRTISQKQAQSLARALYSYQALALLNSKNNKQ